MATLRDWRQREPNDCRQETQLSSWNQTDTISDSKPNLKTCIGERKKEKREEEKKREKEKERNRLWQVGHNGTSLSNPTGSALCQVPQPRGPLAHSLLPPPSFLRVVCYTGGKFISPIGIAHSSYCRGESLFAGKSLPMSHIRSASYNSGSYVFANRIRKGLFNTAFFCSLFLGKLP